MFNEWTIGVKYNRGDIVIITKDIATYYMCAISHFSDNLVNPTHEEIYWIEIKKEDIIQDKESMDYVEMIEELLIEHINKMIQPPSKKRKLNENVRKQIENVENDIIMYKKRKLCNSMLDITQQIMLLNVDMETRIFLLDKYEGIQKACNSDHAKGLTWIKTVLELPFDKIIPFKVKNTDNTTHINMYFEKIRGHLDKKIHNMDNVKDEIMEFLARKISNPDGKGHVLALCGSAGVGKTVILKTLGEALDIPFYQINFGGLNDVSVLTGHSETYVGSKPGKIVEILKNAGCMNPIIFCDEIDKLSETKSKEINGILTHILDEEQNNKFQDNYLSNVPINLSKVFFVLAFNDPDKIDPIVLNRMKIINIDYPTIEDKIIIASEKMIPQIIESLNFKKDKYINIDKELIHYIIANKVPKEDGLRQLKKCLEKIFNKLNYLFLTGKYENLNLELGNDNGNMIQIINITKTFIDNCLHTKETNSSYMHMYI